MALCRLLLLALLLVSVATAQPRLVLVPGEQMRVDLAQSIVVDDGEALIVTLRMQNDNGVSDEVLPWDFRRWWHVKLEGLDPATTRTLRITVQNPGYRDIITPVWSLNGSSYERLPGTALPEFVGGEHRFTVPIPPGAETIGLAKYYPWHFKDFRRLRAFLNSHPHVREEIAGQSVEGRVIYLYTVTDSEVPDKGKIQVWVHSAVHPAETPAMFMMEGLAQKLLSDGPEAAALRRRLIVNLMPMPNPDGVYHGNYRTNARSVNLEMQHTPSVTDPQPEALAIRRSIDRFMGTAGQPGANPVQMLLNLHAAHGRNPGPFHFLHRPDYRIDGTGITPEVRALEDRWVKLLGARNAWVARASNAESSLGNRSYIEAYMHDAYTLAGYWPPVMAITIEGVYQVGPDPSRPSTREDFRQVGHDIALAMGDYFGVYTNGN